MTLSPWFAITFSQTRVQLMSALYDPFNLRGATFRNRIGVSPMCQYSCSDGYSTDWHLVHLGSRAVGGAALVCTEATAVSAQGRISLGDLGIYREQHIEGLSRIARFISEQGAIPAMQLAHAGRKASCQLPWEGGKPLHGAQAWTCLAPSAIPFEGTAPLPRAMTQSDIDQLIQDFTTAAKRAVMAGFQVIEIHAAHGYLLHEFLSPLVNHRDDRYGGTLDNRSRLLLDVVDALRGAIPERQPLLVRLSCSDWSPGGWSIEESVQLARHLHAHGVDLIDCSSGGQIANAAIPVAAGYQVPFSERIRREAGIATAAVGMITQSYQADEVIRNGRADLVFMAREMLRDPYWPLRHAAEVQGKTTAPIQYRRAFG
jgi:2,4-dienoyl-CoA reductase-like NADH-dependent reductase (Old Yellow Enzyme family)